MCPNIYAGGTQLTAGISAAFQKPGGATTQQASSRALCQTSAWFRIDVCRADVLPRGTQDQRQTRKNKKESVVDKLDDLETRKASSVDLWIHHGKVLSDILPPSKCNFNNVLSRKSNFLSKV